jgi:hypothetical protein
MRSPKHLSIHRWYVAPAFFNLNGMLTQQYDPKGMMKEVASWSESFIAI